MELVSITEAFNILSALKQIYEGVKVIGEAVNSVVFALLGMFGINIPSNMIPLTNMLFMLVLVYFSYKYLADLGKYLILIYILIIVLSILAV